MRWEQLFDDLEGQLAAAAAEERAGEVSDRTRRERARLRLVDRLRVVPGAVTVGLTGGVAVSGAVSRLGVDWLLLAPPDDPRELLVPTAAVQTLRGLGTRAADPSTAGQVFERLTLGHALRAVARDRREVVIGLRDGQRIGGIIDRVGADHVDVTERHGRAPGAEPGVTVTTAAMVTVQLSP